MTRGNLEAMSLDELRRYVLSNRDDVGAFQLYVDRSKESGRMISINPSDPSWEEYLDNRIHQVNSDRTKSN